MDRLSKQPNRYLRSCKNYLKLVTIGGVWLTTPTWLALLITGIVALTEWQKNEDVKEVKLEKLALKESLERKLIDAVTVKVTNQGRGPSVMPNEIMPYKGCVAEIYDNSFRVIGLEGKDIGEEFSSLSEAMEAIEERGN